MFPRYAYIMHLAEGRLNPVSSSPRVATDLVSPFSIPDLLVSAICVGLLVTLMTFLCRVILKNKLNIIFLIIYGLTTEALFVLGGYFALKFIMSLFFVSMLVVMFSRVSRILIRLIVNVLIPLGIGNIVYSLCGLLFQHGYWVIDKPGIYSLTLAIFIAGLFFVAIMGYNLIWFIARLGTKR